jgi:hypothetical protein
LAEGRTVSWRASAWAKEQRLGSPAAKSILLCLADYADPEHSECWPSQAQLAADAEVSERTAREWLQRLDDWGLIARERRSRANVARASDRITLNLGVMVRDGAERCREVKDQDEAANPSLPAESAGRTYRQPDAEPTGNEAQPTGNQFRAYKDEPSIEPLNGASQPRASARESGEDRTEERSESREALERRFWKMARGHPQSAGMPKQSWLAEWLKLDPDARDLAERRYPAWLALLKAQDKRHVPVLSTYFAQALLEEVPETRDDVAPTSVEAGRLSYEMVTRGGNIRLKYLAPRETLPGVVARPWGKRTLFAGTFMRGGRFPARKEVAKFKGHVWRRLGGSRRFIVQARSGMLIPVEMTTGATRAAFEATAAPLLQQRLDALLARLGI